jgi:hypothetical protein
LANGHEPRLSRSRSRWSGRSGDPPGGPAQPTASDIASDVAIVLSALPIYGLIVTARPNRTVRIEGTVRTEADRESAERVAQVPGVQCVDNALNVDSMVGSMPVDRAVLSPELAAEIELNHLHIADGTEIDLNERVGTTDTASATDDTEIYFAPTDPPTRPASREDQGIEVIGGFSPTSLDAPIDFEQLPRPLLSGDDEIARQVRLALQEDALTADLPVRVTVRDGVVRLRGLVDNLSDVEAAEDVASRVPNVREVIEELDVR